MPLFLVQAQSQQGNITYQPDIINQVSFSIVNRDFTISYGSYYMAFRPYFQWNGTIYTAQQALTFLNTQYPNARYSQIMEKVGKTIHWGFNYTNLPPAIQNNLQAIYFKLEDYNFPLSNVEVEEYFNDQESKNYTRILIPKANLAFDFADIISQDFTVQVNRTGIAIFNVAGKADLYLDPITYSAPTITVIGYSSATPCTFTDIFNADVAGGWGVVFLQGAKQLLFNATIVLGNGTSAGATYFSDSAKQIDFLDGIINANGGVLISVTAYSYLTLGTLYDVATKATRDGVTLSSTENTYWYYQINTAVATGTVYLYGCNFLSSSGADALVNLNTYTSASCRVWNCMFSYRSMLSMARNGDVYNLYSSSYSGLRRPLNSTVNRVLALGCTFGLWLDSSASYTAIDVYGRNLTYAVRCDSATYDEYLVNCDFATWSFQWYGTCTNEVYRQYSFDLKVQTSTGTAIENATLSLLTNVGTEVFTDTLTNSSGMQDTQTVTRGFYNQTGGDTLYDYGPFTLSISKEGYETYTQVFTLSEKTDWTITLEDTTTANNAALIWSLLFGALAFALFLAWRVRR